MPGKDGVGREVEVRDDEAGAPFLAPAHAPATLPIEQDQPSFFHRVGAKR